MMISLEINNPYYLDGLADMTKASGIEAPELCSAMITRCIEDYVESVKHFKRSAVKDLTDPRREENDIG